MMSMTFEVSSSVTLLFDIWDVNGPAGMALSVLLVLLLTVFYEVLKVWRVWLGSRSKLAQPLPLIGDSTTALCSSPTESSLSPTEPSPAAVNTRNRSVLVFGLFFAPPFSLSWLLHTLQTLLHMLQVSLGYMLMLCVMSYNTWIFLGVIVGSALGYFISFPLLGQL